MNWNGEGLPPVGTECEVLNNVISSPKWEKCKILFMGKFTCVYDSESLHERVAHIDITGKVEFRKIKSDRDKAIEDMRNVFEYDVGDQKYILGALYDAGYRKINNGETK